MNKKRVVGFLELFDEIPEKAKYISSKSESLIKEATTDSPGKTVIETLIHYYEVEDTDFEDLMQEGFFKLSKLERYIKGAQKYKISLQS